MYIAVSILIYCLRSTYIDCIGAKLKRRWFIFFLCFFKPNHGCKKDNRFLGKAIWTLAGDDACIMYCIRYGYSLEVNKRGNNLAIQEQINTAAPGTQQSLTSER